jgi:hypothetical protein
MILKNVQTGQLHTAIIIAWYNKPIPKCEPKIFVQGKGGGDLTEKLAKQFVFYSGSPTDLAMANAAGIKGSEIIPTEEHPF